MMVADDERCIFELLGSAKSVGSDVTSVVFGLCCCAPQPLLRQRALFPHQELLLHSTSLTLRNR